MTWPPTSLTAGQIANARIIAEVGKSLGASQRDIQIALMTAMQESELTNINYGDQAGPDSRGLFQQRDAWGPLADRMDPYKSAHMFFTGGQDGQRGLLDFRNRDQMSLTQAAQAVQVSAYPDAYAKWASLAEKYLPELGVKDTQANPDAAAEGMTAGTVTTEPQPTAADGVTPTMPGIEAAAAPGAEAVAAPGAQSATGPQYTPQRAPVLDEATFDDLFPDANTTRYFSFGMANRANLARRADLITDASSYLGIPYVWGGNSRAGLDCIAEGSMVATKRGDIPIERVKPGDLVLTRKGWRMVLRAWMVRDDAEVVELRVAGRTLRATADHRVWTQNRGWVPVACVTGLDTLVLCHGPSESSSTDGPTSATRTLPERPTGPTSRTERVRSTEPSGPTLTAPSPQGSRYITWTTTPSTTTFPTWHWFPSPITAGRALLRAVCTITRASSVARRSNPWPTLAPSGGSVASNASGSASIARRGSGTSRVYDLTVEGEHEFFADGVLVHNCSGLVQQVYKNFGVDLPRLSADQIRAGQSVSYKNLMPGDLIGWDNSTRNYGADHIAIYAGNGNIIEAPRPGLNVRIRPLSEHEKATALGAHFAQLG